MDFKIKQDMLLMIRALYFSIEEPWALLGKKYNITPAGQHVLYLLLTNNECLSHSELSELGCWHISTVTRLLIPLKKRELVSITNDSERPKYKKVKLTQKGKELITELINAVNEMEYFPLNVGSLDEKELNNFIKSGLTLLEKNQRQAFSNWLKNTNITDLIV